MNLAWRRSLAITAAALSAGAVPIQTGPLAAQTGASDGAENSNDEIVVTGFPEIVVNGRARRCRPAAGDPLDSVIVGNGTEYMAIVPTGQGGYAWVPDAEQMTGPEFWQRVGVEMGQYVFRAPSADQPMCVGARRSGIDSFAGFRRIVDAAPFRGHRVRFTAWATTGRARQVNFWMAAGTAWQEKRRLFEPRSRLLNGGNTNNVRFGGNHGWTPILLETGPIHEDADHISYGFNLQGSGDVWVYEPKLQIVADRPEDTRSGDLIVIGRDQG